MPIIDHGLELLDDGECRRLLGISSVGRVGLSVHALPVILPVNFRLIDGVVRFWSAPGLKLDAALGRQVVAFEVDHFDEADRSGWSVLVVGLATEVADPEAEATAVAAGLEPWVDGERGHLVEIGIEFLSGRRIVPGTSRPA